MRSLATGLAQAHRMQTKTHSTRRPNHQKCLTKPRCQQKVSHRPAAHAQLKRNRTRAENRNLTAARTEPPAPLDSSMNAAPDDAFPRDAPYSVASEVLCRAALGRDAAGQASQNFGTSAHLPAAVCESSRQSGRNRERLQRTLCHSIRTCPMYCSAARRTQATTHKRRKEQTRKWQRRAAAKHTNKHIHTETQTETRKEPADHFCASRPTRLLIDLPGCPTPATDTLTAPSS